MDLYYKIERVYKTIYREEKLKARKRTEMF